MAKELSRIDVPSINPAKPKTKDKITRIPNSYSKVTGTIKLLMELEF
jgi:hypothetical protein